MSKKAFNLFGSPEDETTRLLLNANRGKQLEDAELQRRLSRRPKAPVSCPIAGCNHLLFPSLLLVHLLHKHARHPHTLVTQCHDREKLSLRLNPNNLKLNEPHCLALMMYGGTKDKPKTRPAMRSLSTPNAGLMHDNAQFINHLPIMVMVCRSTWYALLPDKQLERDLEGMKSKKSSIYVMWLVAPQTSSKVNYTLTVFDKYHLQSCCICSNVRNLTDPQLPSQFMPHETSYLVMRGSELKSCLVANPTEAKAENAVVQLEVFIHESEPAKKTIPKDLAQTSAVSTPQPTKKKVQNVMHNQLSTLELLKAVPKLIQPRFPKDY